MKLDTYRSVETPEGVELGLRVAGPAARLPAFGMDLLFRAALYMFAGTALGMLGEFGMGLFLIFFFLLEWFYFVLFEVFRNGATPGKKTYGLRVVHDDGTPIGWTGSMLRNLLRFADFLPIPYGFGLASCMLSRDFKRLGDHVAGTVVVYADKPEQRAAPPAATPVAPPIALSPEERSAILDFADRTRTWTHSRSIELSDILSPITGAKGEDGLKRALGMAAWLQEN